MQPQKNTNMTLNDFIKIYGCHPFEMIVNGYTFKDEEILRIEAEPCKRYAIRTKKRKVCYHGLLSVAQFIVFRDAIKANKHASLIMGTMSRNQAIEYVKNL